MLVFNPPVQKLFTGVPWYLVERYQNHFTGKYPGYHMGQICNRNGITVGDIYDATNLRQELLAEIERFKLHWKFWTLNGCHGTGVDEDSHQ